MAHDLDAVSVVRIAAVAESVANCAHAEEALTAVVQAIKDIFRAQTVAVLTLAEGTGHLRVKASRGLSDQYAEQFKRPLGSGIYAEVVLGGMPVLLSEAAANRQERDELRLESDFGSAVVVPLTINHRAVGCLYADHRLQGHFKREDLLVLRGLGFLAALAVEKAALHEQVSRLAIDDDATGLFTYSHFLGRLTHEVARAIRYEENLGLLLLRLRNLPEIADAHGPAAADDVLHSIGGIIKENIRGVDFAARFAPDQIIVCLIHAEEEALSVVAERLSGLAHVLAVFPRVEMPEPGALVPPAPLETYVADVSLYVAGAVAPEHGRDASTLVGNLQSALIQAASAGPGQLTMFDRLPS